MEPVIVLTGTIKEFEEWCMENGRDRKTAIQITHPDQFQHDPNLEIVLHGSYDMNNAYHSQVYRDYLVDKALKDSRESRGE